MKKILMTCCLVLLGVFLVACTPEEEQVDVQWVANNIIIIYEPWDDKDHVTRDIVLPITHERHAALEISWLSNNIAVIEVVGSVGKVIRPLTGNAVVELTVVVAFEGVSASSKRQVIVLEEPIIPITEDMVANIDLGLVRDSNSYATGSAQIINKVDEKLIDIDYINASLQSNFDNAVTITGMRSGSGTIGALQFNLETQVQRIALDVQVWNNDLARIASINVYRVVDGQKHLVRNIKDAVSEGEQRVIEINEINSRTILIEVVGVETGNGNAARVVLFNFKAFE